MIICAHPAPTVLPKRGVWYLVLIAAWCLVVAESTFSTRDPAIKKTAYETGGSVFSGGMEIGWDYGDNAMGLPPDHWGQINQACEMGEEQSPIDIKTAALARKVLLAPSNNMSHFATQLCYALQSSLKEKETSVSFSYVPTSGAVRNDGKSLIVDVSTNIPNTVIIDKKKFQLHQYRFHSPSEHKVGYYPKVSLITQDLIVTPLPHSLLCAAGQWDGVPSGNANAAQGQTGKTRHSQCAVRHS